MTLPGGSARRALERRKALAVAAVCAFAVAIGYGVLIPVLPAFIASLDSNQGPSPFGVGAVTSAYAAAALLSAPLLGAFADRRHSPIVGAAMLLAAAFATAMAAASRSTEELAAWRFLAGFGAAGVGPYLQGWLARSDEQSDEWRTTRLVMVSLAATAGFLVGPFLGQLAAELTRLAGGVEARALGAPFYVASLVLAAPAIAFVRAPSLTAAARESAARPRAQDSVFGLLMLALVASTAIAAFEVTVSLAKDTPAMSGGMAYALLSLCTLVMFAAQGLLLRVSRLALPLGRLLTPALALLGLGLVLLGVLGQAAGHVAATSVIALSGGVVAPLVAREISLRRRGSVGALVGVQSIFVSAGQALGGLAAGALAAALAPQAVFIALGGATLMATAGYGAAHLLKRKHS